MANTQTDSTSLAALYLSQISYIDETEDGNPQQKADIITALGNIDSSAQGPWKLVWGPSANEGNMAYVALNAAQDRYAVVIRGTVSSDSWAMFDNVLEDADGLSLVDWVFPQNTGAEIAAGFQDGLENIIIVPDPTTNYTLMDFLRPVLAASNAELLVTGHSLGGGLATTVALWLENQLPNNAGPVNTTITPITFAAPGIGNQDFANLYDSTFPSSIRYVNQYDVVPMGYGAIETLICQYPSPGPTLKAYNYPVYLLLEGIGAVTDLIYVQTNQKNGTVSFAGPTPNSSNTFPEEVGIQHSTDTYEAFITGTNSTATAAGK
jgi:hypothetical protein